MVKGQLARTVAQGYQEQQTPVKVRHSRRLVVGKDVPERDDRHDVHKKEREGREARG
jgi:hypothetical protein